MRTSRTLRAALIAALATTLLAAAPAEATPQPDHRAGDQRLTKHLVPSPLIDTSAVGGVLSDGRTVPAVNVLLPRGYHQHPKRRYPVLYLLHGADGGYDNYETDLQASKALDDLQAVVVMPDGGTYGMYTDWYHRGKIGSPSWATYELFRVRTWVENHYRIKAGRRWHAIAGISMGGQGALRLGTAMPGYFGSIAGMSAAVPDMQDPQVYALFPAVISQKAGTPVTYEDLWGPLHGWYADGTNPLNQVDQVVRNRVYLTYGDGVNCEQDPVNPATIAVDTITEQVVANGTAPYVKALRAAGGKVRDVQTCGVHTWGVWKRALRDIVDNWGLFRPVKPAPTTWTYRSVMSRGIAWRVSFRMRTPVTAPLTLRKTRTAVVADGFGTVSLRAGGCRTTVRLPDRWRIPARCR